MKLTTKNSHHTTLGPKSVTAETDRIRRTWGEQKVSWWRVKANGCIHAHDRKSHPNTIGKAFWVFHLPLRVELGWQLIPVLGQQLPCPGCKFSVAPIRKASVLQGVELVWHLTVEWCLQLSDCFHIQHGMAVISLVKT